MNKTLLDIYFGQKNHSDLFDFGEKKYHYLYLGDSITLFERIFYPYIESLEEQQLRLLVENLTNEQKNTLLEIPENYLFLKNIGVINDDDLGDNTMELNCYERLVKSYKHPAFFDLLHYISVDKTFSLDKENHGFGYHFHLYEKTNRTATLLTFDRDEIPINKSHPNYDIFDHTLFYEAHSEGSNNKKFQDINSKNSKFKTKLYGICKNIVVHKIYKPQFKKPSSTKSTKCII